MNNNNNNNNKTHPYIREFQFKVKNDGTIIIIEDKIFKKKPKEKLTVDLIYDKNIHSFLDMNKNVYKSFKTIKEIHKL